MSKYAEYQVTKQLLEEAIANGDYDLADELFVEADVLLKAGDED
jgi:hypothetical protein